MNVPKLRFPEFNGEWKVYKVDNLFTHVRNGFVGTATPYYVKEGIPYLQSNNIRRNRIDKRKLVYVTNEFHEKNKKSILKKEDILMVQSGHAGECAVVPEEFEGANCHALIVMSPTNQINSHFCAYYINSSIGKRQIHKLITGNTIQHILASELKKFKIIIPTITEQEKIASFLLKIDEKIEKLDKKEQLWQIYRKVMIQQLFSRKLRFKDETGNDYPNWEEKVLKDTAIFTRGPFGGSLKKSMFVNSGYKVYEQKNAIQNSLNVGNYYISEEKYKEMIRFSVSKGDLLVSCSGTIGKILIIPEKYPEGIINQALLKIRVNSDINNLFLKELLQNSEITRHIFGGRGAAIKNVVSVKELKEIKISLPSLEEQTKIANFLLAIDKKIKQINKKLEFNKEFKKGLLRQMFPFDKKSEDIKTKDFSKLLDKHGEQSDVI
ncbi:MULTISPECIES: restriction endonuclease subunit S [Methanobacterium]|uniref:Type I restriction modification DNA specificity domain-containing protein n=1 Tax=Methanobacterium bryantii TaxID=2161 RepID=A0A2A2H7R4_METBR|nr:MULTISPECIES: restriction endonuclease subunit S [Methanobacterium]OEC84345.1 hypothetical protein A9507_15720 [Methanobacterium sp. A39]PAV05501.1 hypothetical protein ASJ80_08995 [Methanobacterium bryantii]